MKTILVANQKGGIGKTSTVTTLASIFDKRGYKTLVIDADYQCNTTDTYRAETQDVATLYDVLLASPEDRVSVKDAIQQTTNGLIVPGDPLLNNADLELYNNPDGIFRLKEAIQESVSDYDFILIDSGPRNDQLLMSDMIAADMLIIPAVCDRYSLQGLATLSKIIYGIKKRYNPDLDVLGILPIKYRKTNIQKAALEGMEEIAKSIGTNVLSPAIRECTSMQEAQAQRMTIMQHKPNCTAASDYKELADYIIRRTQKGD